MIIAVIIAVVLAIVLAGLFAVYHKVFYSPHRDASETNGPLIIKNKRVHEEINVLTMQLVNTPCEFVKTRSCDGLTLSARYYHHDDVSPICLCMHGYRGSAVRDFSAMGQELMKMGYNVLIPDERAHWRSGGHTITYGIRERYDVLSWINYINERFGSDRSLYLFGISMGAGTVLMASGLYLPDNVKAISADCPFNVPKDIICHVSKKIGFDPSWAWPLIRLSALIYGHLTFGTVSAAEAVKHTKIPILIIHGEEDDFVPPYMSEEVQQANPAMVERYTFPEANHGTSYFADTERYLRIVKEFLRKHS